MRWFAAAVWVVLMVPPGARASFVFETEVAGRGTTQDGVAFAIASTFGAGVASVSSVGTIVLAGGGSAPPAQGYLWTGWGHDGDGCVYGIVIDGGAGTFVEHPAGGAVAVQTSAFRVTIDGGPDGCEPRIVAEGTGTFQFQSQTITPPGPV